MKIFIIISWLFIFAVASAACIPFSETSNKVGNTICVAGTVNKIYEAPNGIQYLNFCDDLAKCPFTIVVFPDDLRDVGDIRALTGKAIEIHGKVREYDGHPEIILSDARQLRGEAAKLPPVPREYDVERRGRFSAGHFKAAKAKSSKRRKRRHPPLPAGGMEVPPDQLE